MSPTAKEKVEIDFGEMPEITDSSYNSVSMTMDHSGGVVNFGNTAMFADPGTEMIIPVAPEWDDYAWHDQSQQQDRMELVRIRKERLKDKKPKKKSKKRQSIFKVEKFDCKKESIMAENSGRRLVKVIVVDKDENVPLEKCVLYSGKEQMTDLTNQELFFEIDIKNLLENHNKMRGKIIDKENSTKDEKVYLEPIKIRDLVMSVATIATF